MEFQDNGSPVSGSSRFQASLEGSTIFQDVLESSMAL